LDRLTELSRLKGLDVYNFEGTNFEAGWRAFLPGPPPTYELLQFSNSDSGLLIHRLLFVEVRGYGFAISFRVEAVGAVEVSVQVRTVTRSGQVPYYGLRIPVEIR
jgi:hypothetical protein